jgi:hypothetical protein
MTDPQPDLDVAISFEGADRALAVTIRDGLAGSLKVFEFTDRQEELAGTDGLESLRWVFHSRARLVVILMRATWGTTWWTRVEMEAISDRFLKEGLGFLFIVTVDEGKVRPPWIPDKLIRFNVRDFPVEQAIGAIKLRATELGASLRKESVAERAVRAKQVTDFERRRTQLHGSYEGVAQATQAAQELMRAIARTVSEAKASLDALGIRFGAADEWCGLKTDTVAAQCAYRNHIVNTLSEAKLFVRDIRGGMLLPGESGYYVTEPKVLEEVVYRPDLARGLGWGWRDESDKLHTSEEVAEAFVTRILRLVEADAAGELPDLW